MTKIISMIKFNDGELITITFDTLEDLEAYISQLSDYIDKVVLKARFTYGNEQPAAIEIIEANT